MVLRSLLTCVMGLAMAFGAQVQAAEGECSGREKLKVKCRERDDDGGVVQVRIKHGEPNADVTVRITGDDGYLEDIPVTLDGRGKAKIKVRVDDDDDYMVTILECDVNKRVECDD